MKRILVGAGLLAAVLGAVLFYARLSYAAPVQKEKTYVGVITQINLSDGSMVIRLRDGSTMNVASPYMVNSFISVKGTLDDSGAVRVSSLQIKDSAGKDAIPYISSLDPGVGQVGAKVTIKGTGFTKKNSIAIGSVKNALVNVPSKDGKTINFTMPAAPCDQRAKTNCAVSVLTPGPYNLSLTNENGLSNTLQFQILPLPPLTILTDILPQAMTGARYNASIDAIGGAESYIWRIVSGNPPPGMLFAQGACKDVPCKSSGILSGMPTTAGTYQFTVSLTSRDESVARQFSVTVVQGIGGGYTGGY